MAGHFLHFDQWIGIDQTGAARLGGKKAAPLPVVRARRNGDVLSVGDVEWWSGLDLSQDRIGVGFRTAVVLDCVLGLPVDVQKMHPLAADVRKLLEYAAVWKPSSEIKEYGREVAAGFFSEFSAGSSDSRRECEVLSGAQSVFKTMPWQRNIQTGTWRMWRELGHTLRSGDVDLKIWPQEFQTSESNTRLSHVWRSHVWLFEAWPTLLWKSWLRQTSRKLENGVQALSSMVAETRMNLHLPESLAKLVEKDANVADSLVMAVSAAVMDEIGVLTNPWPGFMEHPTARSEGWIIGLSPELRHV